MMAGVVICAASASGNAFAQDASPADKEKALAVLETSKKGVLDATKGLSEAVAPDKWSVAECAEHIAAAEDFILGIVVEKVMKAPAAPDRDIAKIDAGILAMVPDRTNKIGTSGFGRRPGSLRTTGSRRSPTRTSKTCRRS